MNRVVITLVCYLILAGSAQAATFSYTTTPNQDLVLAYFAAIRGVSVDERVQQRVTGRLEQARADALAQDRGDLLQRYTGADDPTRAQIRSLLGLGAEPPRTE